MSNYVHYGANSFSRDLFRPIENQDTQPKPRGGLWASAVNAPFGWRKWCEKEDYMWSDRDKSFTFRLRHGARVYHIHSVDDVQKMPEIVAEPWQDSSWYRPDFERMRSHGIDAIELHLSDDWRMYDELYGWDCDCILIMNPDVIQETR